MLVSLDGGHYKIAGTTTNKTNGQDLLLCRKRGSASASSEDEPASQSASEASDGEESSEEAGGSSQDEASDDELAAIKRSHKRNAVPERVQPERNRRTAKATLKEESDSPGTSFSL